jgi:hypothetical protein
MTWCTRASNSWGKWVGWGGVGGEGFRSSWGRLPLRRSPGMRPAARAPPRPPSAACAPPAGACHSQQPSCRPPAVRRVPTAAPAAADWGGVPPSALPLSPPPPSPSHLAQLRPRVQHGQPRRHVVGDDGPAHRQRLVGHRRRRPQHDGRRGRPAHAAHLGGRPARHDRPLPRGGAAAHVQGARGGGRGDGIGAQRDGLGGGGGRACQGDGVGHGVWEVCVEVERGGGIVGNGGARGPPAEKKGDGSGTSFFRRPSFLPATTAPATATVTPPPNEPPKHFNKCRGSHDPF